MWDSGLLLCHICCTFDLAVFKVTMGHSMDLKKFRTDGFQNNGPPFVNQTCSLCSL